MSKFLLNIAFAFYSFTSFSQHLIPVLDVNDQYPFHPMDGEVFAFTEWQGQLVVGGKFSFFNNAPQSNILLWNGQHATVFPGGFVSTTGNDRVTALVSTADHLYAGGKLGASKVVQKYDGAFWYQLGGELDGDVNDLEIHNDLVYAATASNNSLLSSSGGAWSDVTPLGFTLITDLETFGNDLFICGEIGAQKALAKFDGVQWTSITFDGNIIELERLVELENELFACGSFESNAVTKGLVKVNDQSATLVSFDCPSRVNSFCRIEGKNLYSVPYFQGVRLETDSKKLTPFDISEITVLNSRSAPMFPHNGEIYVAASNVTSYARNSDLSYRTQGFFTVAKGCDQQGFTSSDISTSINSSGVLFHNNFVSISEFEMGDSPEVSSLFASAIWASAISNGESVAAAALYDVEEDGWSFGPVSTEVDQSYAKKYARTWLVTSEMIEYHQTHFSESDYIPDFEIMDWPGNGNFSNGEAHILAPFFDVDGDSFYEPLQGDYPLIRGDQAAFVLLNDQRADHGVNVISPMNVELHVMIYSYDDQIDPVRNTLFVHVDAFNRSEYNYDSFRLGVWNDFDIGSSIDDYVGCDTMANVFFGYNGDIVDEATASSNGYGYAPPALGCVFLNRNLVSHVFYNNSNNPVNGVPSTTSSYFHYMRGQFNDGNPVGSDPLMFSDSPCIVALDNEVGQNNAPGDRRSVGATNSITLLAGAYTCFDFAYVLHHDTLLNNFENACALSTDAYELHDFYNTNNLNACELITEVDHVEESDVQFSIYPNPADEVLYLQSKDARKSFEVIFISNALGEMVKSISTSRKDLPLPQSIDVSDLKSGIYNLTLIEKDKRTTLRWVKI
jgi:hypothetical protein